MSNAYINQILCGHSHRGVTKEYIDGLLPNMLTNEWLAQQKQKHEFSSATDAVVASEIFPSVERHSNNTAKESTVSISAQEPTKKRGPKRDSLFWAIYESQHPKEAFLRPSAKNVEIETRVEIIDQLKKTPKRLKETNSKLTLEQTQALFGAMLTAREDRLDFCVAYSVYYNKHILVVYPKTYRLFSPTQDSTVEDDDHVIILYVTKDGQKLTYSAEQSPSKSMADDIMRTHVPPMKAQSTYKTPELESIAERLGIPTRLANDGKRRKKEDIYNDIRVIIHNDIEFINTESWHKN